MVFERFIWAKTLVEGLYAKKKKKKKLEKMNGIFIFGMLPLRSTAVDGNMEAMTCQLTQQQFS